MEEDRVHQVCLEVLKQSYRRLYFELRFLEQALFRLLPEENERIYFGSDGEKLYYDREYLLKRYLQAPEAVSCDYLHTVIHCLYQHPFQAEQQEGEYWNLASDIAVTDVLGEMEVPWLLAQIPRECFEIVDQIKSEIPIMSSSHIAAYLQSAFFREEKLFGYQYVELAELFQRDSHARWNGGRKEASRKKSGDGEEKSRENAEESGEGTEREKEEKSREGTEREREEKSREGTERGKEEESGEGSGLQEGKSEEGSEPQEKKSGEKTERGKEEESGEGIERETEEESGEGSGLVAKDEDDGKPGAEKGGASESGENIVGAGGGRNERETESRFQRLSTEWKETAEGVAMNARSFSRGQGKMPGSMLLAIQRLTREQYDYAEFLRKFAVMNERMKINMDEFDYSYYLYGLRALGNIPLIEPLEYKEEKQIREFVIVIDTSGSCSGELVGRFLNKTYNILSQMECFADQIILHIIQCDAKVQEDVRIDSLEHMEEYITGMQLRGGGGTDFRPAFAYVEELCESGEFKRLCGLLYFTDGYGTFPGRPPDYKTAFVFVERDDDVRVPPWAMRIYLERV